MSERIRTAIQAEFRVGRQTCKGKIRNVGDGGVFVGTLSIPQEGESVDLQLRTSAGVPIQISGMVWWTTRTNVGPNGVHGFGLRLFDADCEDFRRLRQDLSRPRRLN
jgi:hypothetical protein